MAWHRDQKKEQKSDENARFERDEWTFPSVRGKLLMRNVAHWKHQQGALLLWRGDIFLFLSKLNFWWLYFYSFPSVHALERWRRKSQKWLASSLWQLKKLGKVSKLFCETSSEFNISSEICLKNEYDSPPLCIKEYNNNWCWWWRWWCWWWWWRWCWRCSGAP